MAQLGNDNNSKYNSDYCRQLIEHMASGCSFATFGARIGVGFRTLKRWEKNHPEFLEASELGQLVCMYTWEKIIIGQANGSVKGIPATTIFALKNYFPDRFKENLALQGNGNTIVVFDSGVPTKNIENNNKKAIEAVSKEVNFEENDKISKHRVQSSKDLPDFLKTSYILEEGADIPDLDKNRVTQSEIITEDDI